MKDTLDKDKIPFGENYRCPECKQLSKDSWGDKEGLDYPQIFNQKFVDWLPDRDVDPHYTWDELNYCPECKIEYYYKNGT